MPQAFRFPYFKLYTRDWLAGQGTGQMTAEQEGAYIRLLCHAWNSNPPCTLPNDDELLARLGKIEKNWRKAGPLIKKQFHRCRGRRLKNEELWRIYKENIESHNRRAKAGKKGGKARKRGGAKRRKQR